jgi:hypothetical protein
MSNREFLLCQSVRQFLNSCNWDGTDLDGDRPPHQLSKTFLASWECLTVQQFLHLCGWEGEQVDSIASSHLSSQAQPLDSKQQAFIPSIHPHAAWFRFSVNEFFSHCNWQGRPPEDVDWGQLDPYARMKQKVKECFQFIPWEGNPEIGTLPKAAVAVSQPKADEPTFTDLSDLF